MQRKKRVGLILLVTLMTAMLSNCGTAEPVQTNSENSAVQSSVSASVPSSAASEESSSSEASSEEEPRVDRTLSYVGTLSTQTSLQMYPCIYIGATRENMDESFNSLSYREGFLDCHQALEFVDRLNEVDERLRNSAVDTTDGEGFYINTDRKAGNDFLALCGDRLTLREVYYYGYDMITTPPYSQRYEAEMAKILEEHPELDEASTHYPSWISTIDTSKLNFTLDFESEVQEDVLMRRSNLYPWSMEWKKEELQAVPSEPRTLTPQTVCDLKYLDKSGIRRSIPIMGSGHPPLHSKMPVWSQEFGSPEYLIAVQDDEEDMILYCDVDWGGDLSDYTPSLIFGPMERPYLYDTLLLFEDGTAFYLKIIDSSFGNWFVMQKDADGEYKLQEIWMQLLVSNTPTKIVIYSENGVTSRSIVDDTHYKEYDQQKALRIANIPAEEKP